MGGVIGIAWATPGEGLAGSFGGMFNETVITPIICPQIS